MEILKSWGKNPNNIEMTEKLENSHYDMILSISGSSKRKLRNNLNSAYRSLHICYGKVGVFILAGKKSIVRSNSRMLSKI